MQTRGLGMSAIKRFVRMRPRSQVDCVLPSRVGYLMALELTFRDIVETRRPPQIEDTKFQSHGWCVNHLLQYIFTQF